jgi:hypothetical protein
MCDGGMKSDSTACPLVRQSATKGVGIWMAADQDDHRTFGKTAQFSLELASGGYHMEFAHAHETGLNEG